MSETETTDDVRENPASSESAKPSSKKYLWLSVTFFVATLLFAYQWYLSETRYKQLQTSKNYDVSLGLNGDVYTRRWRVNGNKSVVLIDMNRDNNYEHASIYNFSEQLIYETFDDNEDGYDEWGTRYTPSGEKVQEYYDLDGDGCHERLCSFNDNMKVEYKDIDFDCEYDSVYVYVDNKLVNTLDNKAFDQFLLGTGEPGIDNSEKLQRP